jgi:hypothetical protein
LQIITQKESDQKNKDSMLELEIETNYSEDAVEKDDDNLTAEQQKMKWNCGMKRPIASGLQEVNRAIEKFKKISDDFKTQEDEFDCFGRSLAIQLKNMPLQRALICQQELQKVMMDERMYQLNESTQHTNSPPAASSCYSSVSSPYSAHSLHPEGVQDILALAIANANDVID